MRSHLYLLVLLSLVILSLAVDVVDAQERLISETEYNKTSEKAFVLIQSATYRVKRTVDARDSADEPWKPYSYTLDEYIGRSRSHTQITMLILGHTEPQTDVIKIDDTVYVKRPNGSWGKYREGTTPTVGSNDPEPQEYKQLPDEIVSGQKATIFQKAGTFRRKIGETAFEVIIKQKNWFDNKGRPTKTESITVSSLKKPFKVLRITSTYEYDSNIKIEAPIR